MEYTTMEIFTLVLVFILLPLACFGCGFVLGRINGAKNLVLIAYYLSVNKAKRNLIDARLEKIEVIIKSIQRGSE